MKDKRRSKRFKASQRLKYTKVDGHITVHSSSILKDVSHDGLCTTLSKLVKKGDELLVGFSLHGTKTVSALAKVIWAEKMADDIRNMCGLRFLWLSSEDSLDRYLKNIANRPEAFV
jgi:hypothetical protein